MTDFREHFVGAYLAECEEHLTVIRRSLLALEASVGKARPDRPITDELFRAYHSLKGLAGMVEDRQGELLSHEMETYLRAIREGDIRLTTNGIEALIEGTTALERTIAARRDHADLPDSDVALTSLRALVGRVSPPAPTTLDDDQAVPAAADWECVFTPSPALIARGVNVDFVRARLRARGEIISASPLVTPQGVAFRFLVAGALDRADAGAWRSDGMACQSIAEAPTAVIDVSTSVSTASASADASAPATPPSHYVRVDLARLDELMRMIGDLVILRARLADTLARVEKRVPPAEWRAIVESTGGIERQLRELREGVMRVRLVPVGEIFRRMPFVVRDLARDTGRRIRVELSGQDTEIDKFLVERIMDPILHLVRNAVSHGLEPVDERIAAGKPLEGTLSLSASTSGDIVIIEIADDGRGVDGDRVVAQARKAGLAVPTELDDAALFDMICAPGFSTRDESDRMSGRGFGMSVVRTTVQDLGGAVRMMSTPGVGTRFVIELPLTLAITDALIARVGGHTFAVPQAAVREVIALDASVIRTLEGHEVTPYRGGALPVVRLASVLGIDSIPLPRFHAFVIGTGAAAMGLIVDRILGQREIVVRTTVDPLIHVEGIAGATDLGDGRAVLILDAPAVMRGIRTREIA